MRRRSMRLPMNFSRDFDENVLAVTLQGLVDQWLEQGLEEEPKQVLEGMCRVVSMYRPSQVG